MMPLITVDQFLTIYHLDLRKLRLLEGEGMPVNKSENGENYCNMQAIHSWLMEHAAKHPKSPAAKIDFSKAKKTALSMGVWWPINELDSPDQPKPKQKKKRAPRVKRIAIPLTKKEWMMINLALCCKGIELAKKVDIPINPRLASIHLKKSDKHFRLAAYIDQAVTLQEPPPEDNFIPF